MKQLVWVLLLGATVSACTGKEHVSETGGKSDLAVMKENLKKFEDSLQINTKGASNALVAAKYADKCIEIAHAYPNAEEAPKYLDKAHIILSSVGLHQRSVMVADELVRRYPRYKNRPMVLESLASSYDVFIVPRKKEKVKYYYELLLKEDKDLPEDQRKQIEKRLKYIDLPFEEVILKD